MNKNNTIIIVGTNKNHPFKNNDYLLMILSDIKKQINELKNDKL